MQNKNLQKRLIVIATSKKLFENLLVSDAKMIEKRANLKISFCFNKLFKYFQKKPDGLIQFISPSCRYQELVSSRLLLFPLS